MGSSGKSSRCAGNFPASIATKYMGHAQPKLRSNLTVSQQGTAAGTFFVVKEPASSNFFRLGEAEHFIAQQFDGNTPVEVVRQRAEARFEAALPAETLDTFIRNLEKRGLLEGDRPEKETPKRAASRITGNPLYLRFKAFDPTRLFD